MSEWYEITDPDDIELVEGVIEVNFNENYGGACYVTIPAKMIFNLLTEEQLRDIIAEIEAVRRLENHERTSE